MHNDRYYKEKEDKKKGLVTGMRCPDCKAFFRNSSNIIVCGGCGFTSEAHKTYSLPMKPTRHERRATMIAKYLERREYSPQ